MKPEKKNIKQKYLDLKKQLRKEIREKEELRDQLETEREVFFLAEEEIRNWEEKLLESAVSEELEERVRDRADEMETFREIMRLRPEEKRELLEYVRKRAAEEEIEPEILRIIGSMSLESESGIQPGDREDKLLEKAICFLSFIYFQKTQDKE
jgi:hypothetical protein